MEQEAMLQAFDSADSERAGVLLRRVIAAVITAQMGAKAQPVVWGLHLDAEGVLTRTQFARALAHHHRSMSGSSSRPGLTATLRKALQTMHEKARQKRRQQYLCVRGSSALNSLSGSEAFKLSVVRVHSARRLRRIYESMDVDHNGRISSTDLKAYLQETSLRLARMATGIFNSYDRAGQGFMTFRDFLKMLYPSATRSDITRLIKMAQDPQHRAHIDFSAQRKREIEAMFEACDEDRSGTINEAEFVRGMQALGHSEEAAHDMFAIIDEDHSGTASIGEFLRWYQRELAAAQGHADLLSEEWSDSDSEEEGI